MRNKILFCLLALSLGGNAFAAYWHYHCQLLQRTAIAQTEAEIIQPMQETLKAQKLALSEIHTAELNDRLQLEETIGYAKALYSDFEVKRREVDSVRSEHEAAIESYKRRLDKLTAYYEKAVTELPALKPDSAPAEVKELLAGFLTRDGQEVVRLQAENSGLQAQVVRLNRLLKEIANESLAKAIPEDLFIVKEKGDE